MREAMTSNAPARNVAARAVTWLFLAMIRFYGYFISPLLGANCRHLPTCSQYAGEAIATHGILRGGFFALKRILRCHPFARPMFDPVPDGGDGAKPDNKHVCHHQGHHGIK